MSARARPPKRPAYRSGGFSTPERERDVLRTAFLQAVAEVVPAVLDALRDEVLPAYRAAYDGLAAYADPDLVEPAARDWQSKLRVGRVFPARREHLCRWGDVRAAHVDPDAGLAFRPELLELRTALEAWARGFHLEADWCLEAALETLSLWHQYPAALELEDGESLEWPALGFAWWAPYASAEARFTVTLTAEYRPDEETRAQVRARILAAFERELDARLDAVESRVEAAGWGAAHTRSALERHLRWAVEKQVLGWSWQKIQHHEYVGDERNLRRHVHRLLTEELGFQLPGPGRPRARRRR